MTKHRRQAGILVRTSTRSDDGSVALVDRTSGLPVYRQVAATIRERIDTGAYPPGKLIPSERDLGDEFGISRVTVRQAIGLLRTQGVVVVEHGRGVFTAPTRQTQERPASFRLSRKAREQNRAAFLHEAATAGFTPTVVTSVGFEEADTRVSALLEIEPGTPVTVRSRTMSADGTVVQLATSRLPRALTRDTRIEEPDTGPGGIYARLEDAGHRLDHFAEYVGCRMPDTAEQSALQIPVGVPVLTVTRVAHADVPVEVNDMVMAGDRYELSYEWPAG